MSFDVPDDRDIWSRTNGHASPVTLPRSASPLRTGRTRRRGVRRTPRRGHGPDCGRGLRRGGVYQGRVRRVRPRLRHRHSSQRPTPRRAGTAERGPVRRRLDAHVEVADKANPTTCSPPTRTASRSSNARLATDGGPEARTLMWTRSLAVDIAPAASSRSFTR